MPREPHDEPSVDRAFFETDDPELRAFAEKQTGRKVLALVVMLLAVFGAGAIVGAAIYFGQR